MVAAFVALIPVSLLGSDSEAGIGLSKLSGQTIAIFLGAPFAPFAFLWR